MSRFFAVFICLGVTLILLGAICWAMFDQLTFVQRAPTAFARGTITSVIITKDPEDGDSCSALVAFSTDQNRNIEFSYGLSTSSFFIGNGGSTICGNKVGDVFDIAYHTSDPNDARVIPPGGFLFGNWAWLLAFFFVLAAGGTITVVTWKALG